MVSETYLNSKRVAELWSKVKEKLAEKAIVDSERD